MGIELNWLAILTATLTGMVVAGVWYSKAFGHAWSEMTGVTKGGKTAFGILWAANFITAIGLNFLINISKPYCNGNFIGLALFIGFVLWLAFSTATLVQHNAFEHKPIKLTLINIAYQLALYLSMALVFGLFG